MQHGHGSAEVYETPHVLQRWRHSGSLTAQGPRQWARSILTQAEEALLLGNDPAPRRLGIPPQEIPKPKIAAQIADPQDAQEWIPLPPLGFGPPAWVSCPPPLEDAKPLVSIPWEAQLDITSLSSMGMITVRNTLKGEFEYCYWIGPFVMTSLHLNPFEALGQPGIGLELMDK